MSFSCRMLWLLGLMLSCFANESVMKNHDSLSYNVDKLPPELQNLYHRYYEIRDDLLRTKRHTPTFIVINLDGKITQFHELGDAIWQCDYPNGLVFALGSEDTYRIEILTIELEVLLFHSEVPAAHPKEMKPVPCDDLKLQRGVHGDTHRLYVTLPHRVSGSSTCFPVNHLIDSQSPINSVLDDYWKIMKLRGFPVKNHPNFGDVVFSMIGAEKHMFLSSTEASRFNVHAKNVCLLGHSLYYSQKLQLEAIGWKCPPVVVAYDWKFEDQPCTPPHVEL